MYMRYSLLLVKVCYKTLLNLSFTFIKAHTDHQLCYPWSALLFQGQLDCKLATFNQQAMFVNGNYLYYGFACFNIHFKFFKSFVDVYKLL